MDLANNKIGRSVGKKTKTDSQALTMSKNLANKRKLVTLK